MQCISVGFLMQSDLNRLMKRDCVEWCDDCDDDHHGGGMRSKKRLNTLKCWEMTATKDGKEEAGEDGTGGKGRETKRNEEKEREGKREDERGESGSVVSSRPVLSNRTSNSEVAKAKPNLWACK